MLALLLLTAANPVTWVAPSQCPSAAEVRGAVEHYIARELGDEALRARATVERTGDGAFALELRIENADGVAMQRSLGDADCRVLADAAALMVAIALDPAAASRATEPVLAVDVEQPRADPKSEPEPEPKPKPKPKHEPSPPPVADTKPAPERPPCLPGRTLLGRARLRPTCGAVGARLGLQLGPLPRFGPGLGGYAAILWPRLRLEVSGKHWFEQPARTEADPSLGGDLRLTVGAAVGCGRLGFRRVEFDLCGGFELGALRGIGFGVQTPREDRLLWAAALADVRAGWAPVRRFAIQALVGTAIPLQAYRFGVAGLGTVHEAAPASLRAGVGAEVRFP